MTDTPVHPAAPAAAAAPRASAGDGARAIGGRIAGLAPGVLLCVGVTLLAMGAERVEGAIFGHTWLEALVLAILIGTMVRTAWTPSARWREGITFSAKMLLEIAVMLLGASISASEVMAAGPALLIGIPCVVALSLAFSYSVGRVMRLPHNMAVLVACGNSICGNSAIAAVAPIIGATSKDVAASIAFTAVLGVAVVLILPAAIPLLHMSSLQYGVLAGLTVYAVPQVLAAAAPAGSIAVQIGTLVKLIRVLMLGPVVLGLSMLAGRQSGTRPGLSRLVPWFIIGFLGLGIMRSLGLIPHVVLAPIALVAGILTVVAMAALGLGTDLRTVARAGGSVTATVTISLLALGTISFLLIRALGVG